ncbi:MAG: 1,4-dihydroxy-2-naphthoyl-CoA synthase [Bifidobacteriaceae bacterium]|jgi:naphthoate synthase|nr:1,4-dihydroxy-2-naphthoyl-CoA synthase [Bifidobacteriaceae bacterium]
MSDLPGLVSAGFTPKLWREVEGFEGFTDITYHRGVSRPSAGGVSSAGTNDQTGENTETDQPWVRIAFNRPEVRNAFNPSTVDQLIAVLRHAAEWPDVIAVLLTGNGPSPVDGGYAFCSGGDQRFRGPDGYEYGRTDSTGHCAPGGGGSGRLHIVEAQHLIRTMPKVVIALVDGWAAGGGHSLAVVADLTIACREHGRFKQTDATVGSFDAGYGSALLARQVGQKRARQIFFLAEEYSAEQAAAWGAVNLVVAHDAVEAAGIAWGRRLAEQSPGALRMLKFAFNLADDGLAGQQVFAGEATRLAYGTAEAADGRDAFLEHRPPRWDQFRKQIL